MRKKKQNQQDNEQTKQFDIINDGKQSNKPNNTTKKTKKKKPGKIKNFIASSLSILATLFVAGVIGGTLFITSTIAKADKIDADTFERLDSTVILDAEENVIYDLGDKLIENVEYDEISQTLIDAFVAIEDARFFSHKGFDIPRFSNALVQNAISSVASFNLSFDGGGASTIDMQLVKNVVFTYEDTQGEESVLPETTGVGGIKRKINEIYYANRINSNKILDKKVIFQKYVNIINFGAGNNMLGVQKAADFYFGKDVSELSLVESAFLAGVINAPNRYTPYYKLSLAEQRTHTVLEMMNYHGYITDAEYKRALTVPIENLFVEQQRNRTDASQYQAYIDIVLDEVEELTGLNPVTNSMIIKTAMNPELQAQFDRGQNREIPYLDIQSAYNTEMQLAATVIENDTGEVIASFGGYDYFGQRIINRSYHSLYQPGSTVKPVISYAPAFEYLGYATSHVILDEPYTWSGTSIELKNWSRSYLGEVPLLESIVHSYNIPAVKTFDEVSAKIGLDRYTDYAEAAGFRRYAQKLDDYYEAIGDSRQGRDAFNPQFAIGGHEFYTNTQELAGSTAMIMNGGDYIKPHTIREVELKATGEVIKSPHKKTPVLSDAAAYLTSYTMKNVIDANRHGPVERNVARSYPVYAKTGTSNWSSDDAANLNVPSGTAKDRLLLTATDRFSIATWSGFDPEYVNKKDGYAYHSEALKSFQVQARLASFTLDALQEQYGPGKEIPQPSSVKKITHILGTFPYQSPIDDMNPDLITSGLVKSEYASLVPATPPELESFKGATVDVTQENHNAYINVKFKKYPDEEKLIKAPDTLEFESGGSGKRLYDPSWIFGPVRYTTEVYVNGKVVETVKTEERTQNIRLQTNLNDKVKVCTFYGFELNETVVSNKDCVDVEMDEFTINVPDFKGKSLAELQGFASEYNMNVDATFGKATDNLNNFLTIEKVSGLSSGKVKVKDIQNKSISVTVYDYRLNKNNYTRYTANDLHQALISYKANLSQLQTDSPNNWVSEVVDSSSNQVITDAYLSDYYNNSLTLYIRTESDESDE